MALEDMGASFVKLGQILSTRADLLPPAYQAELSKLQDQAKPLASGTVERVIAEELGRPVGDLFSTFDPAPLASASIGQVHLASLQDGTEVVVKVRRPGVVEQIEEDLEILRDLAAAASRRWEVGDRYDLVGLAQEFAETLRSELDYIKEGRSAERFTANFATDADVHIPRVFWETSTARVLTLERINGLKIDDLDGLAKAGIDRRQLAEKAARIILKMVFEDGFFHADPHPGNFFIESGGRIGIIDFGMVGTVDARTQEQLSALLLAVTSQDADRLADAFLELGVARQRVNRAQLSQDLGHLASTYYGRPLGEIKLGPIVEQSLEIVRRHHLHLPSNLALLLKAMAMNESLGSRLDPDFRLTSVLVPYAQGILLEQYSPGLWARRLGRAGVEAARLGTELPTQLRRLMGEIERGSVEVGMRPEGFEPLVRRFEQLANRIVLGIIAAAFINGLAILMSVYHPPGWQAWVGAVFAVGFVVAVALGAYLAWAILRSR